MSKKNRKKQDRPRIRHMCSLGTLGGYGTKNKEWSVPKKLKRIKKAGFQTETMTLAPGDDLVSRKLGYVVRLKLSPDTNPPMGTFIMMATLTREVDRETAKESPIQASTDPSAGLSALYLSKTWSADLEPKKPGTYRLKFRLMGGLGSKTARAWTSPRPPKR